MSGDTNGQEWVTLTSDEQVVWSGGPNLRAAVGPLVCRFLLAGLGFGLMFGIDEISGIVGGLGNGIVLLQALAVGLIGIGLGGIVLLFLRYWSVQYVLTTEKVYKKTGLLSRTVRTLWIDRIQHTACTQTARERFLECGTITIETAGGTDAGFNLTNISFPDHIIALLTEQCGADSPLSHGQHPKTRDNAQVRAY